MKTSISKITMQGFKSFNKRISIPLLPGFNVVAGPNGSGKSNIVDAIVFVIGRTSAKSLRADRLHELIFHGGEGKSAADYTAVSLYLDNSQKVFPFAEEEVVVTRKVNRRGVSAYKLNGRTVTREKILGTLSAARIRPDGHNIVLQGDVTQIIEMNPVERRYVLDEISGIAEYNDKKEKAQRDLDMVDDKLKEAEIIITQRYDIFKKLEDERNAAIRYRDLQNRITTFKASLARKKIETYSENIGKFEEEIAKKENIAKNETEEAGRIDAELEGKEKEIRSVAEKVIGISKTVEIQKEISDLRSKILINRDKIDSNLREIERLDSLVDKLEAIESRKVEMIGDVPRPVQAILKLNLRGVYGTVANLISVPEKYKIAIEVAAGPHINDIVTEDESVASFCIEYLKKERIGRATFLPLNKVRPAFFKENELLGKSGVIGIVSKQIKFDTKYMSAMEFVFGNTLIVEDLNLAKAVGIGRARMVTLDGDLLERSGVMIGGHYFRTHPKVISESSEEEAGKYREMRKRLQQDTNLLKLEAGELDKKLKGYAVSEPEKKMFDLEKMKMVSEHEVDELRLKRRRMQERKVNLEIDLNRLRIEKARLESELDIAKQEMENYKDVQDVQIVDEKIVTLENNIKKIEKEFSQIGLVNMKAIEEYERLKNEFEGYKQKYEKILEEKKAVLSMIDQIESKRKEVFNKTLAEINKEFQEIFSRMAKGSGSLELEDPNNIESGLEIQASPRGKILLNIDSMSGGEKTLTAMAFLFAIQRYRPAPFYILDEVDAALDKENSRIIAELVKNLSKESQFIVITHNDQTIREGDRVYGVTMEKNESKILGLELPKT